MIPQNSPAFLFDDVRVEPATFRAFKAGNALPLEPKSLRLLLFLIENRGRLIEKREILEAIWNGTHVTENALAGEIAKLRKTLGDNPKAAQYIQTVHTRGYRFIAEVTLGNGEAIRAGEDSKEISETGPAPSSTITRAHSRKILSIRAVSLGVAAVVFLGLMLLLGGKLWDSVACSAIASR